MEVETENYFDIKRQIQLSKREENMSDNNLIEEERVKMVPSQPKVGMSDMAKVGSAVLIGGGVGMLAGVAAIAITATVADIIIAGVITKIAGVVGGAAGLRVGLDSVEKAKERKEEKYERLSH